MIITRTVHITTGAVSSSSGYLSGVRRIRPERTHAPNGRNRLLHWKTPTSVLPNRVLWTRIGTEVLLHWKTGEFLIFWYSIFQFCITGRGDLWSEFPLILLAWYACLGELDFQVEIAEHTSYLWGRMVNFLLHCLKPYIVLIDFGDNYSVKHRGFYVYSAV